MTSVFVRKVKRDGATGVWGTYPVDHDEHGHWLYTPQRSLFRGTAASGDVVVCHAGWPDPPGVPVIHLVPTTGWWFARWQVAPAGAFVAIDICSPCELRDGTWSYEDLELDLVQYRDGTWRLDDQEEFDREVALGRITTRERQACLDAVAELQTRFDAHDDLFARVGWSRLDQCSVQDLAPLVELP